MIKANELRIGNYIAASGNPTNIKTWVIGKVNSISSLQSDFEQIEVETDEEFTWFFKDKYFGIPLTEKWLLKFGFENDLHGFALPDKMSLSIHFSEQLGFVPCYSDLLLSIKYNLKYVHQLQNLYFALTGEELTFKIN